MANHCFGCGLCPWLVMVAVSCRDPSDKGPPNASLGPRPSTSLSNSAPGHAKTEPPSELAQPGPSSSSPTPPQTATHPTPSDPSDDPAQGLLAARRLVSLGKYADAARAYQAIVDSSREDANPTALGELGYLELLHTKASNEKTYQDLWLAAGSAKEPKLQAQIWYNLGLFEQRRHQTEAARQAFARSLFLNPTPAARKALGMGSTCQASIAYPQERLPLAQGWLGVCRQLGKCGEKETFSEAGAQTRVIGDQGSSGSGDGPPYVLSHDYMSYHITQSFIAPLPKNRFFVHSRRTGNWPATCDENHEAEQQQDGDFLHVTSRATFNTMPPAEDLRGTGFCWSGPTMVTEEFFAIPTGRLALRLTYPDESGVEVKAELSTGKVTITGGGCHEKLRISAR